MPCETLEEILSGESLVSAEQLSAGVKEWKKTGAPLGKVLVKLGFVTENALLETLSERLSIPYLQLSSNNIDPAVVSLIPARAVTHYGIMPVIEHDRRLTIAVSDPLDFEMFDELKLMLEDDFDLVISTEEDIAAAIKAHYGIGAETIERMIDESSEEIEIISAESGEGQDIDDETVDASVIKFVNQIITEAIKGRATDIHLEPFEDEFRIRYRIDGLLYEAAIPPAIRHFQSAIVSRMKIMASLNIAEKRLPQDGRIKIRMKEEEFDLRVSILPTSFGEGVNIRILSRSSLFLGLEELGLPPGDLSVLTGLIKKPHGIVLVTGPTGSGKTTTLYAALSTINSTDRKIITIEDPIEYQLKGVMQMQVLPRIGFTFANALRSMLRHDPDIMMVGEIRDLETAEITIRTALTGHLVFSTLHTNDAAGAVTRLVDMGIEPFLVSSSVEGIVAQRLVRVICSHCKEEFIPREEVLRGIRANADEAMDATFYRGKGCEQCRYSGYRGRTGIYEILVLNDEIMELVLGRVPSSTIRQKAQEAGMKTLRRDGWKKVRKGLTTIEEVLRVTQEDEAG